ncbi:DUF6978 family protein [Pseudoramibacter alactolyticus]|jgi:hypothetical protein|uniref:DUF6978 family protein n=1 Tax=Pseudoramibacter alactolyticus TaxID=113287 RepID=UPI00248D8B32|nr:hypothetical protein [Pseudoramibacter alactolyticus]
MNDAEFKRLIKLKKWFEEKHICLPNCGENKVYKILSDNNADIFWLDTDRRGKIELNKSKLQTRYSMGNVPLVRLEIDAPEHQNPDGSETGRNHIHIYRDGYGLSWAYDLADAKFEGFWDDLKDFSSIFPRFCEYCNIEISESSEIQGVLT